MTYNDIAISSENNLCEGFFANMGKHYILGINLSVAKQKIKFSHAGSRILDEINAFDAAEVACVNLGQTNMIKVSSFCGPRGMIWGLDLAKAPKYKALPNYFSDNIHIFDTEPLVIAFKKLVGTIKKPRFSFLPGSHLPCALKSITAMGKKILYSALAIGIPEDRQTQACLLMEDVGEIPLDCQEIIKYNINIKKNLVSSVVEVGNNQNVNYREVYIGIKEIFVDKNEIGCAMVASPYFLIAKNAVPDKERIRKQSIFEWEQEIFGK